MPILLEGKKVAQSIHHTLANQVQDHVRQGLPAPHLAIILIGEDPASHTYVDRKVKACKEIGIVTTVIREDALIDQGTLIRSIESLNANPNIHGMIVQMPLPPHISTATTIEAIEPQKDVDGLHPLNYGHIAYQASGHVPATPLGIWLLMKHYQIETSGKHCVIVGRGTTVGTPFSILMSRNAYPGNATVTICHSHTEDLAAITRQADILVAAIGQPKLITADMVKLGSTVIDVGLTRVPDTTKQKGYRLQGDVDFETVSPLCGYITPVPGGVGPMTIVALLKNTVHAWLSVEGWIKYTW